MTCDKCTALLQAYMAGSLPPQDQASINDHLNTCADCRLHLQTLQDCRSLDEEGAVPANFSSSWRQAIKKEEETMQNGGADPRKVRGPFRIRGWMAAAAALLVVTGGTLLTRQGEAPAAIPLQGSGLGTNYAMESLAKDSAGTADNAYGPGAAFSRAETPAAAPQAASQPARIIRTISLGLVSSLFNEDLAKLHTALAEQGGYVEYSDVSADSGSRRYVTLTLRVPKEKLDAFLTQIQGVGRRLSMTESQEDISAQYLDLDTRLKTQQTKMDRLQALLGQAITVEDVLSIENAIADAQYQIDSLTGSLRGMDSKVDYASISVSMTEESVAQTIPGQTLGERIRLAVADAWRQARAFLGDMVIFIAVLLPYALAAALIVFIIIKIIRRKKK